MVAACAAAGVKLMVAYRCQYEPYNRSMIDLSRSGKLGAVRIIEAVNTQVQGPTDQWRLNAARAVLGEEQIEVFARISNPAKDQRWAELDETIAFMLRFPSGAIASCAASYGAHESKDMRLRLEKGWIALEYAFAYHGQRRRVAHRNGSIEAVEEWRLGQADQCALEIDHLANCILNDRRPRTPGEEGGQDHVMMQAIYRSAWKGGSVNLPFVERRDAFPGPDLG